MKSAIVPAMIICGVGVFAASGLRGAMMRNTEQDVAVATSPMVSQPAPIYADPGTARIAKEADGHFWATVYVNGTPLRFLVDTGASQIVLSARDARAIGLNPAHLPQNATVVTAAGKRTAGVTRLDTVSIDGLTVKNIDALVMNQDLDQSLLGMSFLSRFSSWEASQTAIVIRR